MFGGVARQGQGEVMTVLCAGDGDSAVQSSVSKVLPFCLKAGVSIHCWCLILPGALLGKYPKNLTCVFWGSQPPGAPVRRKGDFFILKIINF